MSKLMVVLVAYLLAGGVSILADPDLTSAAAEPSRPQAQPDDPPVFAHYYIWFQESSWDRAKIDLPSFGRYSSDDEEVMREHVRLAKEIGIDGFLVSWKSTEVLDPRLEMLIEIAAEADFSLAITYQGLDFDRQPLSVSQIEIDLDWFITHYADEEVFDFFGKPLIVLTGTWEMSYNDLARITNGRRERLLILASEKNVEGYERIADLVDGDLYYWSSVDPETFPGYPQKLVVMSEAISANGGLWIAPVAPGFDAREVGGSRVIDRKDGVVLRRQWNGALASLPDAIGIISWNEFSENTHVEPSTMYGDSYSRLVAELANARPPEAIDFDSSGPEGRDETPLPLHLLPIIGLVSLIVISLIRIIQRSRAQARSP